MVMPPLRTTFRPTGIKVFSANPAILQTLMMDAAELQMEAIRDEIRQQPSEPNYRPRKGSPSRRRSSTLTVTSTSRVAASADERLIGIRGPRERRASRYIRTNRLYSSWDIRSSGNVLTLSNSAKDQWGRFYAGYVHGGFTKASSVRQTWFHRQTGWKNAYEVLGPANGTVRGRMRRKFTRVAEAAIGRSFIGDGKPLRRLSSLSAIPLNIMREL